MPATAKIPEIPCHGVLDTLRPTGCLPKIVVITILLALMGLSIGSLELLEIKIACNK
jgi:hypothetical protein